MTQQFSKIAPFADDFYEQIIAAASLLGIHLSDEQVQALLRYLDGLLLWGKAYNLTAITSPHQALVKHIFDCMAIVPDLPLADKSDIRLLDIGTGAGLPSVIIAILRPDWQITALDSNSKKVRFIRQIISEIGLSNVTPVASRIENHHEMFKGSYDVITSRAFACLSDFVCLAEPCLASDGVLYAMKGKLPSHEELTDVEGLNLRQWQISTKSINVPKLGDDRCVVYLQSI
ncbi:16S rRNA (guanine(527)-N(7))-methyltransferase RsmG [Moraxella nasovis]|uniref:16S rRNA (guanine(527)-N(7))-methyltransferase RsmG n=1 Tax=Moraxella nasovis TaxID=2904121 RepID=UPI001F6195CF|nr:16S rRNA (guanine(527)-N(7))-methyltransferase RsmG [Moraxella nasovis]UNU73463.1 16S rRNA (guanine(527)-N(7))-methyltransferase RsmG [Moraxella nasovis]